MGSWLQFFCTAGQLVIAANRDLCIQRRRTRVGSWLRFLSARRSTLCARNHIVASCRFTMKECTQTRVCWNLFFIPSPRQDTSAPVPCFLCNAPSPHPDRMWCPVSPCPLCPKPWVLVPTSGHYITPFCHRKIKITITRNTVRK